GAALERHAPGLHHVERGLDVGLSPRRHRMFPAVRRRDEMIRLAWFAANVIADLSKRRYRRQRAEARRDKRSSNRRCSLLHRPAPVTWWNVRASVMEKR